jgi:predicted MFS family arabinose efflux permease
MAAFLLLQGGNTAPFLFVALAGAVACAAIRALPDVPPNAAPVPLLVAVRQGSGFVAREPHLRSIAICAIFWNAAFFGLLAVFAVHAATTLKLDLAQTGLAWSAFGLGQIMGALLAPMLGKRWPVSLLMTFGPAVSAVAVFLFAAAPAGIALPATILSFFLIGFGPMIWLIMQTTVRQIVAPPELIGRVSATISVAIYGVRPIGALMTGALAAWLGTATAIWLPVTLFALSLAAILLSPFPRIRHLAEIAPAKVTPVAG